MAFTLDQLNSMTDVWWDTNMGDQGVQDLFFGTYPICWAYQGKKGMDFYRDSMIDPAEVVGQKDGYGTAIRVFLEYDRSNTDAYGPRTQIKQDQRAIINHCDFDRGGVSAANTIDLGIVEKNDGTPARVRLVERLVGSISKSAMFQLARSLLSDRTTELAALKARPEGSDAVLTDLILGLGDMLNGAAAFSGLSSADLTQWVGTTSSDATEATYVGVETILNSTINQRAQRANVILTTLELMSAYMQTLQTQQRFGNEEAAKPGFDYVMHNSKCPIVAEPLMRSATANPGNLGLTTHAFALNTDHLWLKTNPANSFDKPVWVQDNPASQPQVKNASTTWRGAAVTNDRQAHAYFTNFNAAA